MSANILWIDTETSGLKPEINGVLEVSLIADNGIERVEFTSRVSTDRVIEAKALEINGIKPSSIKKAPPPAAVAKQIEDFVSANMATFNYRVGGYNVEFDLGFMRSFMLAAGADATLFAHKVVDPSFITRQMVSLELLPNWKLATAYLYVMGSLLLDAHSSLADIRATADLFYALKEKLIGEDDGR